jgi:hypothetical protein
MTLGQTVVLALLLMLLGKTVTVTIQPAAIRIR